ncbi:zf-HC2 domain-containing protein [Streptomyces daliensis]
MSGMKDRSDRGGEHVSTWLLHRYARGDTGIPADEVWALEAHMETCAVCRERLAAALPGEAPTVAALLDTVRSGLGPRLDAIAPTPWRRHRWTRLSAWVTPAMAPWLAMTVGLTLIALLLDMADPDLADLGTVSPVLLLAPVLPLAGVAASWSRALDPAYELTVCAPRAGLHLLLRRTASVLAVLVPTLLVGGWLTGVSVAQWLLPAAAFTAAALALGGVIGVSRAVVALGVVWVAVILAPALATRRVPLALESDQLPVWGLLLALGVGVVTVRRNAYSALGHPR